MLSHLHCLVRTRYVNRRVRVILNAQSYFFSETAYCAKFTIFGTWPASHTHTYENLKFHFACYHVSGPCDGLFAVESWTHARVLQLPYASRCCFWVSRLNCQVDSHWLVNRPSLLQPQTSALPHSRHWTKISGCLISSSLINPLCRVILSFRISIGLYFSRRLAGDGFVAKNTPPPSSAA